jgi:acyl carrier protein phosphodiesterase
MLGNFLGDFVRKSQTDSLPPEVKRGVELHRFIDTYTDNHEIPHKTKKRVREKFGKYAPVLVDIFYDHCLASTWSVYDKRSLSDFVDIAMRSLRAQPNLIPESAERFLNYAEANHILVYYRELEGIDYVLQGMSRRAKFDSGMERGAAYLSVHKKNILDDFHAFYPNLQVACKAFLSGETTFVDHGE